MSSAVSGKTGAVKVAGTLTGVSGFTVTRTVDQLDATSFDSAGNRDGVDGLFGWNGTFSTNEFADLTGSQGVASFQVHTTAAANSPTFSGTVSIGECATESSVDGLALHTYTYTGRGPASVTVS